MRNKKGKARHSAENYAEKDMVRNLDDLDFLQKFKKDLLPSLQKAVKQGLSAEAIFRMAEPMLAAKLVTEAIRSEDVGKITNAIKNILDRSSGPVTQKVEETHKYENLSEEQIRSLVAHKLTKAQEKNSEDDETISRTDKETH